MKRHKLNEKLNTLREYFLILKEENLDIYYDSNKSRIDIDTEKTITLITSTCITNVNNLLSELLMYKEVILKSMTETELKHLIKLRLGSDKMLVEMMIEAFSLENV